MSSSEARKTYTGGCHCGHIQYTIEADLSAKTANKCNCSHCLKLNQLAVLIYPSMTGAAPGIFTLESPASKDDTGISVYNFGRNRTTYYSCKRCGVNCFYEGNWLDPTDASRRVEYLQVNAVTLDLDQGVDLRTWKVVYWDGRNDNFTQTSDRPFLGGCV